MSDKPRDWDIVYVEVLWNRWEDLRTKLETATFDEKKPMERKLSYIETLLEREGEILP